MVFQHRPVPFHDFALFVVLSILMGGSPNAGRIYSLCIIGGTVREKIEANKLRKIIKWDRPVSAYVTEILLDGL